MKRNRTRIYAMIIIVIVALCIVFIILSGKIQDTYNEYGVTYTYFDTERIYVSALDFSFDLETKATYKEEVRIRSDVNNKFYIKANALTDDVTLRVRDKKSNIICERTLEKTEEQLYISDDVYTEGAYIIEITLPAGCAGSLEITVNES